MHDEREGARETTDVALPPPAAEAPAGGSMTSLFVGAGRKAGIRPGDLVGAIAGEAKISAKDIGNIRIGDTHALVEVPEALADRVIAALRGTTLRGKSVQVRRDRGTEPPTGPARPRRGRG